MAEFDKHYWEDHWAPGAGNGHLPASPYLAPETGHLTPGTALDAGCGAGAEAAWLAEHGWRVTGADISATALAAAAGRAAHLGDRVEWVETDLARWEPGRTWDLVVTHYAHADVGQLALYERLSSWVAPGGTLLVVGHVHGGGHDHPEGATATLAGITGLVDSPQWRVESAYESTRTVRPGHRPVQLRDVVVRARRLT